MNIRNAKIEDMDYIISLAAKEGWNPGISDGRCFYVADENGFFIAEINGRAVACISAVKYNSFGFIGLYIVEEDFRAKGYGIGLWNKAMTYLEGCNIGLDGVVAQQDNYKKSGFWLASRNMRFTGVINNYQELSPNKNIFPASSIDFEKILNYDKLHFPSERRAFLKSWLDMPQSSSVIYLKDSNIKGMGTIRKCIQGYKIGPLYAHNPEIAQELFLELSRYANNECIYLDIMEENQNARAMVEKYAMEFVFETARMYTGEKPQLNYEDIYGITTFELG